MKKMNEDSMNIQDYNLKPKLIFTKIEEREFYGYTPSIFIPLGFVHTIIKFGPIV